MLIYERTLIKQRFVFSRFCSLCSSHYHFEFLYRVTYSHVYELKLVKLSFDGIS